MLMMINVMVPEPKPQSDEDVVQPGDDLVVQDVPPPKKVKFHPDPDDAVLQQLLGNAQAQCTQRHKYSERAMDTLAKDMVVKILYHNSPNWNDLRQKCLAADDLVLYHNSIEGAASLVCMIYNKVSLFRYGHERTSNKQIEALLEEVLAQGVKACPDHKVGKLIVRLTADNDKYSFVTEGNLAEMLTYYPCKIPTGCLADDQGHGSEKNEDQVFKDITKVVRAMNQCSLPILKVDDHTRLLTNFLKKESHKEIHGLVCDAMVRVKSDAMERFDEDDDIFGCLWVLLFGLSSNIRLMLQGHLSRVTAPLFELYNAGLCHIPSEILDIVEVAEIRRMALGSRFIRRSYLIWAFYELGYELPRKIHDAIEEFTPDDKDVPPYHIYMAAIKIAEYCRGGSMQFEHFLYAVIFSKGEDGHVGEEMDETVTSYINFLQ
ncbi:hypothetical protein RND81_07G164100 [Saponaria officinalis]|uniref:Uncharacterized protein n=1 Tax=Saponaria officinalis TaxID=3572 RepID=A0AAW1JRB9_SAPOF